MNLNDFTIIKVQPKVKYPEVWCAVCRRPVAQTIAEVDGSFTARCHGKVEKVPVRAGITTLFVAEAQAAKTRAARSAHNKSRRLFTSNRRNGWRGGANDSRT